MIAKVDTFSLLGIDACPVEVEVDIASGLPAFHIVGLPDPAVREAKERVTSAIKNSQLPFPARRITVNLAPADVKKEGSSFDLPIALGILKAQGIIRENQFSDYAVLGELSLDGGVRRITGALPIALKAQEEEVKVLIIPQGNAQEASVAQGVAVYPVESLYQVTSFLNQEIELIPYKCNLSQILKGFDDS